MKNLFEATMVEEVQGRLAHMRPDSERLWGKMTRRKRWPIARRVWNGRWGIGLRRGCCWGGLLAG
jgi:hypothetical protein